jgi:hypothetical protein
MGMVSKKRGSTAKDGKEPKPAKRAARSGKRSGAKNAGEQKTALIVPENFEDYKGARKELRRAVKAIVKANTSTIAEGLAGKAEDVDMRRARMLLTLIEKKKDGKDAKKKKKRSGPSWAQLLASEPPWVEEEEADPEASQQVGESAS